jgi:hypothetical protein
MTTSASILKADGSIVELDFYSQTDAVTGDVVVSCRGLYARLLTEGDPAETDSVRLAVDLVDDVLTNGAEVPIIDYFDQEHLTVNDWPTIRGDLLDGYLGTFADTAEAARSICPLDGEFIDYEKVWESVSSEHIVVDADGRIHVFCYQS